MRRVSLGCVRQLRHPARTRLASLGRARLGGLAEVEAREADGAEQELCVGTLAALQQRI